MAETTKIVIETEVKGSQEVKKSFNDLRKELKELRDAQGYIAEGSRAWKGLQKSINDVEGKIGDLNDSFRTLTGSGVERLNASIGLFKEGLTSFDFGKIGIALKGLGSAFKAVLPFALIEGLKAIYENWDKIVEFAGKLIPALSNVSKQTKDLQEKNDSLTESNKKLNNLYETQITLLEALGKKDKEVNELKGKILDNDIKQLETQLSLNRAKEEDAARTSTLYEQTLKLFHLDKIANDERSERLKKISDESEKIEGELSKKRADRAANRIKDIDLEIKKTKEHSDAVIKKMIDEAKQDEERSKRSEDAYKKRVESEQKISEDLNNELNRRLQIARDEDEENRKIKAEADKQEQERAKLREYMRQQEIASQIAANQASVDSYLKAEADKQAATEAGFKNAQLVTQNLQAISDISFALRLAKTKKGSAEEEALMRRQFEVNKKLQIASTTIATITGAREAYKSLATIPIIGPGLGIAAAAAATIAGIAAIQKINATRFESSSAPTTDSGGGGFNVNASAPTTQTQAPTVQPFTRLDEQGRVIKDQPIVKAFVVEHEMTDSQKRIGRLTNQALFG